ncbi:NADPH:quinone oxidoreductase family protein [Cupriavidus alkaliphilus]|uniref:NADPH:quinone oxidoreductase family protein n=1 Tax=Cupriavidus alkaliphilus TaxID=942866 RepID=UPI001620A781|nr:NADPH:quinone oxidoreductase family protein [Cupriavidus alkaliphilus]MBB2916857.1 NADPH2:quinone reductase [Cupriavidus alkaliphilus]MBB3011448.1 NADPH2:quinone reductase [Cupriavidus alkaliphilus]
MRAAYCERIGEALLVGDLPDAPLMKGQVRVDTYAAGLNFADLLLLHGTYQEKPKSFPFVPGLEAAGVVVEVCPTVTDVRPGDRVMIGMQFGGYADQAVVDASSVYPIPDNMGFIEAAALGIAYGTAIGALKWRARLDAGETVLVLGASGGAGLAAVQVAKATGAKVVAVASTEARADFAVTHGGADLGLTYSHPDWKRAIRESLAVEGVDVVFDPVGGDFTQLAIRCCQAEARYVVIGFACGELPEIRPNIFLVKNLDLIGFYRGYYRSRFPSRVADGFSEIFAWYRQGRIRVHVDRVFPLAKATDALDAIAQRRARGKVVLQTRGKE